MKHNAFNKLSTILIVVLLITLIIVVVVKLNNKKAESNIKQDQQDNVISMCESDDGKSDDEYTQKTNPDDDGFGTEVGM